VSGLYVKYHRLF